MIEMNDFDYLVNIKIVKNKYQWLFKMLGGCIYCFSTWTYIITFLMIVLNTGNVLPSNSFILALFGILGIGLNYFWIEAILKIKR
jgi:hypothetical protein